MSLATWSAAVTVRHPVGSAPGRRQHAYARHRGAVRACLIGALAVATLPTAARLLNSPRAMRCFCESDQDRVRVTTRKYASEAYPAWRRDHPAVACPSLEQLTIYMNERTPIDPWGTRYRRACTSTAAIVVTSAGADRRFGTADDLGSDR